MPDPKTFPAVSDALGNNLEKLWKLGGLQLTAIFLGLVMMLISAFAVSDLVKWVTLVIGSLFLVMTMIVYFRTYISPVSTVRKELEEKKEFLDKMQETVIELAERSSDLHSQAHQYAGKIEGGLRLASSHLEGIPLIGKQLSSYVSHAESISADVVFFSGEAEKVAHSAATAVREVDQQALEQCIKKLQDLALKARERTLEFDVEKEILVDENGDQKPS